MTRVRLIGLFILVISCGTRESKETKISDQEKRVLFTVKDLIDHGYKYDQPSEDSEKFQKVIFGDGYRLTYKYQTPDSAATKFILISSSLQTFDNKVDAVAGYYGVLTGSTFKAFTSDKIEQREKTDVKIEGDNSKILEFRAKESELIVAYALVNQVDNVLYMTYFMTPYIDKVDVWTSILPDKIRQARTL
jgi:hypothetical protein